MYNIPRLEKKNGTALVLSGGATKAFYFHLGVLKALQHERITSIVGSSAGAVVGAFIANGITVDELIQALAEKRVFMPRFSGWIESLSTAMLFRPRVRDILNQVLYSSLAGIRFLASIPFMRRRDLLDEALDMLIESQTKISGFFEPIALEEMFAQLLPSNNFRDTLIDLYITGTSLDHHTRGIFNGLYDFEDSENRFITNVPIYKAVRASTSLPGLFTPVEINGDYYIDGEIKKTLSADIGVHLADRVIVSHTYQPLYNVGTSVKDKGWLSVLRQTLYIVLAERIAVWRHIYEEQYPHKQIIWIQPDSDDEDFFMAQEFSFRPEVQRMLIQCGERAALKALQPLPDFSS